MAAPQQMTKPTVSLPEDHSGRLHTIVSRLDSAMKDPAHPMHKTLAEALHELMDYSVAEFRSQERFMRATAHPGYEAHVAMHQSFSAGLRQLMSEYLAGRPVAPQLMSHVQEWIAGHVQQTDAELHKHAAAHRPHG